jgi:hypothetical protein
MTRRPLGISSSKESSSESQRMAVNSPKSPVRTSPGLPRTSNMLTISRRSQLCKGYPKDGVDRKSQISSNKEWQHVPRCYRQRPSVWTTANQAWHRCINHRSLTNIFESRRNAVIRKINEPCKAFSTTGSSFHSSASLGPFHGRGGHIGLQLTRSIIGTCLKSQCRYIHDPTKVAACKTFLLKGSCPSGDSCDLSHDLTPERTPSCLHFSRGNCNKEDCRYIHVRVSPSAPVCRSFGIYGYCEKGADCEDRHVHECPDFSNTGKCDSKGCKLIHVRKAHVMRNIVNTEDSDMSSDEDGEDIDSDDVDSDDLEELLGDDDGVVDTDVTAQRDYMGF